MIKDCISRHSAAHRPRDKLITYYLSCFDKQAQELAQAQANEMTMGGIQL